MNKLACGCEPKLGVKMLDQKRLNRIVEELNREFREPTIKEAYTRTIATLKSGDTQDFTCFTNCSECPLKRIQGMTGVKVSYDCAAISINFASPNDRVPFEYLLAACKIILDVGTVKLDKGGFDAS